MDFESYDRRLEISEWGVIKRTRVMIDDEMKIRYWGMEIGG